MNTNLTVLHVIPTMNPTFGGPVSGLMNLSIHYKKAKIELKIIAWDDQKKLINSEAYESIIPGGPSLFKYGISLNGPKILNREIPKADLIIINGIWKFSNLIVFYLCRKYKKPYIVYSHGMLNSWTGSGKLKSIKKKIYWYLSERYTLARSEGIVFTTHEEKEEAYLAYSIKNNINYFVWPYKIAPPPKNNGDKYSNLFFEKFSHLRKKRIILFLGRIDEKKGCNDLIIAFSKLKENFDIHLLMAGPYEFAYKNQLENMAISLGISEKITWSGMINGDLKWGAFYSAEVFSLPSHQENFGVAVVESLSCGLPVLLSDKVNINKQILGQNAGFSAVDNYDGAYKNLEKWFNLSMKQKNIMRLNAKNCFNEMFSLEGEKDLINSKINKIIEKFNNKL